MHAFDKIKDEIDLNPETRRTIEELRRNIVGK
jgi:hypothetical protein